MVLTSLWLLSFNPAALARNNTCPTCSSEYNGFFCGQCCSPVESVGDELSLNLVALRVKGYELGMGVGVEPASECSRCARFSLRFYCYLALIDFRTENPHKTYSGLEILFPDGLNYNNVHHVLFLSSSKGWMKIYLYFASDESIYVQVQHQWFYFSSWAALSEWLAFLLALVQGAQVFSYHNLKPDDDKDRSPSAAFFKSGMEMLDR